MAVATAIDFKAEVKRLFDLFDKQRFDDLKAMFAEEVQGVDEISRKWLRGRASIDGYFKQLAKMGVTNIHSKLSDVTAKHWDDVAVVTGIADQTYEMGGQPVTIKAPLTVIFRRNRGDWKIELISAVPLPETV